MRSSENAGEQNSSFGFVVDQINKRMVALEFRRFYRSTRSEREKNSSRRSFRSNFVDFDFCFVQSTTQTHFPIC